MKTRVSLKYFVSDCSYILSEAEKSLLLKGLIHNLEVLSTEDLDFIKTKTKDIALSSLHICNIYQKENLMP